MAANVTAPSDGYVEVGDLATLTWVAIDPPPTFDGQRARAPGPVSFVVAETKPAASVVGKHIPESVRMLAADLEALFGSTGTLWAKGVGVTAALNTDASA